MIYAEIFPIFAKNLKIMENRLKIIMQEKGINQYQLAELMGIAQSNVNKLVNADSLTVKMIVKLAKALNVDEWELLFPPREIAPVDILPFDTVHVMCPYCGNITEVKLSAAKLSEELNERQRQKFQELERKTEELLRRANAAK